MRNHERRNNVVAGTVNAVAHFGAVSDRPGTREEMERPKDLPSGEPRVEFCSLRVQGATHTRTGDLGCTVPVLLAPAGPGPGDSSYSFRSQDLPRVLLPTASPLPIGGAVAGGSLKPEWDRDNRELTYDGSVVKALTRNATSQLLILAALQNAGWPKEGIINPFRRKGKGKAKNRLDEAVAGLNRAQQGDCRILFTIQQNRVFWKVVVGR